MDTRIFHGKLTPPELGRVLVAEFNRGNLQAQQWGNDQQVVVQIASRTQRAAGGDTALTVTIQQVEDGVAVQTGQQSLLGVAASLGQTALFSWRNPWQLIGRLDDIAQDLENLHLSERVNGVIDKAARAAGASFELSERLKRLVCAYCDTANPVGESNCIACGAPLGKAQPRTCPNCGFVVTRLETTCPNCQKPLY